MKIQILSLCLLIIQPVFASESVDDGQNDLTNKSNQLINAINSVDAGNSEAKKAGTLELPCPNCFKEEVKKIYSLDKEEIKLDDPYYIKKDAGYVIRLKRTKDSPKKISLNFRNGHRVCAKVVMISSPYSNNIGFDCLFYVTEYEDQIIDLNLSKLPEVKEGEDVFEIKFSKQNIDKSDYSIEVNSLTNKNAKFSKDNKFFGRGINLLVSE